MHENAFYVRFGGSVFFSLLLNFSLTGDHQSQKIQKKLKKSMKLFSLINKRFLHPKTRYITDPLTRNIIV